MTLKTRPGRKAKFRAWLTKRFGVGLPPYLGHEPHLYAPKNPVPEPGAGLGSQPPRRCGPGTAHEGGYGPHLRHKQRQCDP